VLVVVVGRVVVVDDEVLVDVVLVVVVVVVGVSLRSADSRATMASWAPAKAICAPPAVPGDTVDAVNAAAQTSPLGGATARACAGWTLPPPRYVAWSSAVRPGFSRATNASKSPAIVGWAPPPVPGKLVECVNPATYTPVGVNSTAAGESVSPPPRYVACSRAVRFEFNRATKPSMSPPRARWAPPPVPGKSGDLVPPTT